MQQRLLISVIIKVKETLQTITQCSKYFCRGNSIQLICDYTQRKNTIEPINRMERLLLQQKGRTKRIIAVEKKDSKKEAVFQQPPTY
jgi:hypothetical protein